MEVERRVDEEEVGEVAMLNRELQAYDAIKA